MVPCPTLTISDYNGLSAVGVGEGGQLSGESVGLVIERSGVRVPAGLSGGRIFFSRVHFLC